jgi:hypothetical protein
VHLFFFVVVVVVVGLLCLDNKQFWVWSRQGSLLTEKESARVCFHLSRTVCLVVIFLISKLVLFCGEATVWGRLVVGKKRRSLLVGFLLLWVAIALLHCWT